MISHVNREVPIESKAFCRQTVYSAANMRIAEGVHDKPDPLWHDCPLVTAANVPMSMELLYGHLTFDCNTGQITHVAPSAVNLCIAMHMCANQYDTLEHLVAGTVSKAPVRGPAHAVVAHRLAKRVKKQHNRICSHWLHDPQVSKTAINKPKFCIEVYERYLCNACLQTVQFRHKPPSAVHVGAGYMAVQPLKQRVRPELWSSVFVWLDTFTEIHIVSLMLNVSHSAATAFILRPREYITCKKAPKMFRPIKRIAAIIANEAVQQPPITARFVLRLKTDNNNVGCLWRNGYARFDVFSFKRPHNDDERMDPYCVYVNQKTGLLIENNAVFVLLALLKATEPLFRIRIANRSTHTGVNCYNKIDHSAPALDNAEYASWARFAALLKSTSMKPPFLISGSLKRSLTNASALSPLSTLIEAALCTPAVVIEPTTVFLTPPEHELAQGDVQTLLLEQTMLSNFTALPKYALPDQPGRLSYFDLLAFITV